MLLSNAYAQSRLALRSLWETGTDFFSPRLRIGVTGLARSGKTVFTTALAHQLMAQGRLPAFRAASEGRIRQARLVPQPDDDVPRFAFEAHLEALRAHRSWPHSTRQISELSLDIVYESRSRWRSSPSSLTLDIVDYPGEWLTDLALLDLSYPEWSRQVMEASRLPSRLTEAAPWHEALQKIDPSSADEAQAQSLSEAFKAYLKALRAGPEAVAVTPPGRFLMPGDLDGSPMLTFAPLDQNTPPSSPLARMMEKRFEAYKAKVAYPFFRDHFQRIDRQVVLVDVLSAADAGPAALKDLEEALDQVLVAFRAGKNSIFSALFAPRVTRILFAATKADHIHHESHDRLEALLSLLVARAMARTQQAGAIVATVALASVRATREHQVKENGDILKAVSGVPEQGERVGDQVFDGATEMVVFPGDLPERAESILNGALKPGSLRFPRFRPPLVKPEASGRLPALPQIRLDKALEFLLGDALA